MIKLESAAGALKDGEIVKQYDMCDGMIGSYFTVKFYSKNGKLGNKVAVFVIPEPNCMKMFKRPAWGAAWKFNGYTIKNSNSKTSSGYFKAVMFVSNLTEKEADEYVKEMCEWQLKLNDYLHIGTKEEE